MAKKNPEAELAETLASLTHDPYGFVHFAYPWGEGDLANMSGPYEWQAKELLRIGKHLSGPKRYEPLLLAIASGHGIGKSCFISWVADWGLSTCEDTRIICTANTGDQLSTKTIPEVTKWFNRSINAHWWKVGTESIKSKDPKHEKNWRIDFLTWSEEKPEAFAGLHNKKKRIIILFDEASSIPPIIWETVEGALTDEETEIIFIAFGNPTQNTGRFRECFGKLKHRWKTRQIDSRTVPGTNKKQLEKWVEDYGEDSDFCRVRVKGEFPRAGSSQFIASDVVALARRRDVGDQSKAHKILSVDVARFGDDESVIGIRQGLRYKILERLRGVDTTQLAMRTMYFAKLNEPRALVIDGDGVGGGVVDYINLYFADWMKKRPWFTLKEFHGAGAVADKSMYYNKRAEVWGLMRDWLVTGSIPDDPEVESDLTGPEYFFSSKNTIQLESKEDMKKRGLASPDIGDNLAMTFAVEPQVKTRDEEFREALEREQNPMQKHFMLLAETERRKKLAQPKAYWE